MVKRKTPFYTMPNAGNPYLATVNGPLADWQERIIFRSIERMVRNNA